MCLGDVGNHTQEGLSFNPFAPRLDKDNSTQRKGICDIQTLGATMLW